MADAEKENEMLLTSIKKEIDIDIFAKENEPIKAIFKINNKEKIFVNNEQTYNCFCFDDNEFYTMFDNDEIIPVEAELHVRYKKE